MLATDCTLTAVCRDDVLDLDLDDLTPTTAIDHLLDTIEPDGSDVCLWHCDQLVAVLRDRGKRFEVVHLPLAETEDGTVTRDLLPYDDESPPTAHRPRGRGAFRSFILGHSGGLLDSDYAHEGPGMTVDDVINAELPYFAPSDGQDCIVWEGMRVAAVILGLGRIARVVTFL